MTIFHKLLAKLGYESRAYKLERFKSEHPEHILISTHLYDAVGCDKDEMPDSWRKYSIAEITGEGVFRYRQKVYIALGRIKMNIKINQYEKSRIGSRSYIIKLVSSPIYHVSFDAINGGDYRFRFDEDKHELQIIYECGDEHKIYTYS